MAKLVFAMNVSLDGYVDHMELGPPEPAVFRHFVQQGTRPGGPRIRSPNVRNHALLG